jgi:Flp pilus assembly protein TadG
MLESAFTMLPIFGIIIGFCNFSISIYRWSTLQNAVREGCRYAITYQSDQAIKNYVQSFSLGLVDATLTGAQQQIFVKYYLPTSTIDPPGTPSGSSHAVSAPGGNVQGNIVVVSVEGFANSADWVAASVAGSFNHPGGNPNLTLNVLSADIMGGLPFGVSAVAR